MKVEIEKIGSGNSKRAQGYVIAAAGVKLSDFNPDIAKRYIAASENIDSRTRRYGCGTPHASKLDPKADLFHHVEHSIGRIAHQQAKSTDLREARTRWSKTHRDQATIVVISNGDDTLEVETAIQKGITLANNTFRRMERIIG